MSLYQLKKLTSKYNLKFTKNDRKFYKKYNYKLGYYMFGEGLSSEEYLDKIEEQRVYVSLNNMYLRRERNRINVYASSLSSIKKYIEINPNFDFVEIGYFPEGIPHSIKLRKSEPEYPWEVKLRRHVKKETLKTFWETHQKTMWINSDSKYELDVEKHKSYIRNWIPPIRPTTWAVTTWRFNDQDVKNLFVFTFCEYLQEETLFKKEEIHE